MYKSFVIWGSAGHAKVLASIIEMQGGHVIAFFDNRTVKSVLPNVPIFWGELEFKKWANAQSEIGEINGLVAIGGHKGSDRLSIQKLFRSCGLNLDPIVHPNAFVCSSARLGQGTQVLAQAVVAADAQVGESCIINHKGSVDHECIIGDGVHVAPSATVGGCVVIGNNVMIGAGAIVLPYLKIGDNAMIGAGTVVTKDVSPGVVILGNPGRPQ